MKVILDKNYYSSPEAAEKLGVTLRTLYSYKKDSKLVPVKVGGRYYYTEDMLNNFIG